ncbi:MAG: polysaccharide biosynthesis C-terminal domain-containing protein [Bacteroidetes bacterium]|nr:polysaccharide biosynthesis C-terminal domain-containing protein [Bacteroidota bacterium]
MTQLTRSLNGHLIWRMLGLGTQLLITIFLSRILGAAESGNFFYFISWLSFFVLIGSGGLDSAITYFMASGILPKRKLLFFSGCWLVLIIFLYFSAATFFTEQLRFLKSFPENGLRYGLIFILGQLILNFQTAFYYGEHQYLLPAQLIFFTNLGFTGLLSISAFSPALHLSHLFLLQSYILLIALQGLSLLCIYIFQNRKQISAPYTLSGNAKSFFSYGFLAFWANLLFFAATRIDYWMLNHFSIPDADIGNYIQVSRLVQLFQILPSMLAAYFFPKTASDGDKIIPYITILIRWIVILNLILLMPIVIGGSYLFPLIFGQSFDQMYLLFILYIPGIFALSVLAIISTYLAGVNAVRINLFTAFIALIIVCVANYLLIPFYGVKAAAMVSSFAYLCCAGAALFFFIRKTGINFRRLIKSTETDREISKELMNIKLFFKSNP